MPIHLFDSNILLDAAIPNDRFVDWSRRQLERAAADDEGAINQIVYSEVSINFAGQDELDGFLSPFKLRRLDLPWPAAVAAGRAYRMYVRGGGIKRSPMPDFYIGAHAQHAGLTLVTRDVRRYRTYFPSVRLLTPGQNGG